MSDSTAPDPTPGTRHRRGYTLLDALARRTGRAPRVSLRDVGTRDASPLIDPKAGALQNELSKQDQGKYRILGEIARGGMGVVLRGHDLELADRADVVERFVEEAQIGGQLSWSARTRPC